MSTDAGAQPSADAQGPDSGQANGLFDDYVTGLPPELHDAGRQIAGEFSKRVDGKLREAAEFRQKFEPLAGIEGLTDLDPEDLSFLVQLGQYDEDQFKEWIQNASQELGVTPEIDEDRWAEIGRENGWIDDDGENELDPDDPLVQQLSQMQEMIQSLQQEVQQGRAQTEQQQTVEQAEQEMNAQLAEVQEQMGDAWNDEIRKEVLNLARIYVEEDNPIQSAFEHYQRLTGGAQADLVDSKLGDQTGALADGATDTTPPATSWHDGADPKAAARARFQQA